MTIPALLTLAELSRYSSHQTGYLGKQLGMLHQAGLPLPPTFVVPRSTLESIATANNLATKISAILTPGKTVSASMADELQSLICTQHYPPEIAHTLVQTYHQSLGSHFSQIVWSPLEESTSTVLREENIKGETCLADSLLLVWAKAYSAHLKTTGESVIIPGSCLIQLQAQPIAAGIAFTKHPTTPHKTSLFISGTWGVLAPHLPSAVLDSYEVDIRTQNVLATHIPVKHQLFQRVPDGLQAQTTDKRVAALSSLTEDQVKQLTFLLHRVKLHFLDHFKISWELWKSGFVITGLEILKNELSETVRSPSSNQVILQAIPVISGVVQGTILHLKRFRPLPPINSRHILVIPVFSASQLRALGKAGGLIFESSLTASQIAQLRRDCHIPVVMKANHASQVLKSHHQYRLNAEAGKIEIAAQVVASKKPTITQVISEVTEINLENSTPRGSIFITGSSVAAANKIKKWHSHQPQTHIWFQLPSSPQSQISGAAGYLENFSSFDELMTALITSNHHSHSTTHIVIPQVRGPQELRLIASHTHYLQPHPHLWWQLSFMSNFWHPEAYLHDQFKGIIIDVPALYKAYYGLTPLSKTHQTQLYHFYPLPVDYLRTQLHHLKQVIQASPHQPQLVMRLDTENKDLLECAVELGFSGIIVEDYQAELIQRTLVELEEHRIHEV